MLTRHLFPIVFLVVSSSGALLLPSASSALQAEKTSSPIAPWETSARLHHKLTSTRGTMEIGSAGISFHSEKGQTFHWNFADIQTFYVARRRLEIEGYESRGWLLPGEKVFHFDLATAVPPAVAAVLAEHVGKPSRNGDPDAHSPAFASIPARHSRRAKGSNGDLRFRAEGIDYITPSGRDSRSWRWADLQTLGLRDAYHFTVGGYLETYDFELKRPMSQALFDRL
jgi:hypothetical protein